ncbi:MAG: PKD domain-containing protein [Cyclobacteriaceae bacterium]
MHRSLLTISLILIGLYGHSQCPPGPLGAGKFLDKPAGCATNGLDIMFTPQYSQLADNDVIVIDWGDGTANEMINVGNTGVQSGISYNTPVPHTYTEANTAGGCVYTITAYVMSTCYTIEETTEESEIVIWNTDNFGDGGSDLAPAPLLFEVCAGTTATVQFEDLSPWNCTDLAVTTSVNSQPRWTRWEYGIFEDITGTVLVDGNTEAYPFQGVVNDHNLLPVLDPQAPGNISLNVDIPATAAIGEEFHVRLHTWNQCNPYEDGGGVPTGNASVFIDAIIRVVGPPIPDFESLDGATPGGVNLPEYCIDQDIYFNNTSTNVNGNTNFTWEFYDTPTVTGTPIGSANSTDATFAFNNGGIKAVRLIASNPDVDAACDVTIDGTVTVTPDVVANVEFYDATLTTPLDPVFCQTGDVPTLDSFTIGIADESTNIDPTTEYRYEIRDAWGILIEEIPGPGYSGTPIADFTRTYSDEGLYVVTLFARNPSSPCSSSDSDTIFVYGRPIPQFTANEVCGGAQTTFSGLTDQLTGFTTRVNDDVIATYEWDFSYVEADGFNVELTRTDDSDFDWNVGTVVTPEVEPVTSESGTHTVAVRITSQKGGCKDLITGIVTVNENPDSQLADDVVADLCPGDLINFTNNSVNPAFTMEYFIEVEHTPSAYFSSTTLTTLDTLLSFPNPDDTTRTYQAILRARTEDLCETFSSPLTFRISPDEESGFDDQNYDIFNTNCSPWTSTLLVDAATQSLAPDSYQWTLSDANGVLAGYPVTKVSTDPDFHQLDYQIENTSNAILSVQAVLEVTKTGVCVSNDTFNLQISPQPAAVFTLIRDEDCDEVVLEIEATQKGLTNYAWTFNPTPDNEFGSDDQRLISYTRDVTTGADFNASISLVTTNLAGCPSEMVSVMETIEKRKPDIIPGFTISSDTIQLPDAVVTLTNASTPDAGYTYLWEFGDGSTSDLRDPGMYTYTQFGSFLIRLTISDEFCEVQTSQSIVVLPADPVIDFVADTLQGCTPLTIQFTNLSGSAEPGEFLWEFGDGSISELDNPIHTYFDDGNYSVRLRGTNNVGVTLETEKTEYIQAYGRPFADFLVSARVVFIPDQEAHFRNLSKNAVDFFWDFGDGTTSTEKDPSHAYTQEGFYSITLVATNPLGCVDTLFRDAEIEAVVGGEVSSPNAFTPNLSGPNGGVDNGGLNVNSVNDIFLPKLEGVIRYKMYIYNKWGQLLFQTNNQNIGWDGYYKGKLAPAGVYVYKLELRYSDGRDEIKAGDVTLIR